MSISLASTLSILSRVEPTTFGDVVRDCCRDAIREFGCGFEDVSSPVVSAVVGRVTVQTGIVPSRREVYSTLLDVAETPDIDFGDDDC